MIKTQDLNPHLKLLFYMNQYLFLFPVKEYFNDCMSILALLKKKENRNLGLLKFNPLYNNPSKQENT